MASKKCHPTLTITRRDDLDVLLLPLYIMEIFEECKVKEDLKHFVKCFHTYSPHVANNNSNVTKTHLELILQ